VLSEKEAASRSCAAAASAAEARRAASASAAPPGSTRAAAAVARRFVGGSGRVGGGGGAGSGAGGGITNDIGDCGVLLVRRRTGGRRPPAGFGLGEGRAAAVDWRATVVLNLALQSSYALAVVACRKGALRDSSSSVPRAIAAASSSAAVAAAAAAAASAAARNEAGGPPRAAAAAACSETSASGPLPPLALPLGGHGVRHDVFASPMRLAFEEIGGATDGSSPEPSYPEICFSVDGASSSSGLASSSSSSPAPLSALSSELELASPGDVFAVFLVATGGPALATGPATAATEEGGGGKEEDGGGGKEEEDESKKKTKTKKEPFVEIFSGFVSYEQLVDALPCAKISASSSSYREYGGVGGDARREHVRMRGPGGKGVADVAVGVLFRKDAAPSSAAVSPAHPSFSSSSSGRDLVARTVAERDGFGGSAAPDAAAATPSSSSALAATARALLRAAAAQRPEAVTLNGRPSGKRTLIDSLGSDVRQAAHLLSLCGLAEAFLMLRTPAELSDGQRYRFAIARCLARRARTVVADEWCAKLDRVTAKVISRNVRRIADQRGVGFLLATTHEDIVADLQPDVIARCGGCGTVEVETRRPFAGRSVFTAGSKSPKAPRRTGRTSLGGITAGTGSGRSGGSTCSGTAASRSGSACSASGRCAARRGTAGSA